MIDSDTPRSDSLMDQWEVNAATSMDLHALSKEIERDLYKERAAHAETRKDRDALQVQLRAWQSAFGTTQLTHALAKMEEAEKSVKRIQSSMDQISHQRDFLEKRADEKDGELQRSHAKWERLREWVGERISLQVGFVNVEMNRLDAEEKDGK